MCNLDNSKKIIKLDLSKNFESIDDFTMSYLAKSPKLINLLCLVLSIIY